MEDSIGVVVLVIIGLAIALIAFIVKNRGLKDELSRKNRKITELENQLKQEKKKTSDSKKGGDNDKPQQNNLFAKVATSFEKIMEFFCTNVQSELYQDGFFTSGILNLSRLPGKPFIVNLRVSHKFDKVFDFRFTVTFGLIDGAAISNVDDEKACLQSVIGNDGYSCGFLKAKDGKYYVYVDINKEYDLENNSSAGENTVEDLKKIINICELKEVDSLVEKLEPLF